MIDSKDKEAQIENEKNSENNKESLNDDYVFKNLALANLLKEYEKMVELRKNNKN